MTYDVELNKSVIKVDFPCLSVFNVVAGRPNLTCVAHIAFLTGNHQSPWEAMMF